jgi:hypothetical protein
VTLRATSRHFALRKSLALFDGLTSMKSITDLPVGA